MATASRGTLLWTPSEETVERANVTHYQRWLAEQRDLRFGSYNELWEWSVGDLEAFWASIWDFCEVRASKPYERVLGRRDRCGDIGHAALLEGRHNGGCCRRRGRGRRLVGRDDRQRHRSRQLAARRPGCG